MDRPLLQHFEVCGGPLKLVQLSRTSRPDLRMVPPACMRSGDCRHMLKGVYGRHADILSQWLGLLKLRRKLEVTQMAYMKATDHNFLRNKTFHCTSDRLYLLSSTSVSYLSCCRSCWVSQRSLLQVRSNSDTILACSLALYIFEVFRHLPLISTSDVQKPIY